MEYNDFYLKFSSEDEWQLNYAWIESDIYSVDIIGTLVSDPGYPPREGYHVNVRTKEDALPPEFEQFEINKPEHPSRIWF